MVLLHNMQQARMDKLDPRCKPAIFGWNAAAAINNVFHLYDKSP
jgi:hypothetical protein